MYVVGETMGYYTDEVTIESVCQIYIFDVGLLDSGQGEGTNKTPRQGNSSASPQQQQ